MATTSKPTIKILRAGKYRAEVLLRDNLTRYPNCPFMVSQYEETPKAKYHKEKNLRNTVFPTLEKAITFAEEWTNRIQTNINTSEAYKEQKRKENAEVKAEDHYKDGDIIVTSWGYEQTNVSFYIVTEVKGKTITISQIYQETEKDSEVSHGMACNVIPAESREIITNGETFKLRVKARGDLSSPSGKGFIHFSKWSGRPMYKSWYY